jgi:hypothetical protein
MNHALEILKAETKKIQEILNGESGGVVQFITPEGVPMLSVAGKPDDFPWLFPAYSENKELLASIRVGDLVSGRVAFLHGGLFDSGNFMVEDAGSRKTFENRLRELEDAIADLEKPKFCAVIQQRGTIQPPKFSNDLAALIRELHAELDEEFDHETDDARVFNEEGQTVYVFTPLWELERYGDAEYITENGGDIVTMRNQGAVLPGVVKLTRVYPNDEENQEGESK